jgi:hypothetical protein
MCDVVKYDYLSGCASDGLETREEITECSLAFAFIVNGRFPYSIDYLLRMYCSFVFHILTCYLTD